MAESKNKKVATSFRLTKKAVEKIEKEATRLDITKCDYIESLLEEKDDLEKAKAILAKIKSTHQFTIVRTWAWQCLEDLKKF